MNPQNQICTPVDEADDWEPAPSDWAEDEEAMQAFAITQGIKVEEPRIRPNKYLGEK